MIAFVSRLRSAWARRSGSARSVPEGISPSSKWRSASSVVVSHSSVMNVRSGELLGSEGTPTVQAAPAAAGRPPGGRSASPRRAAGAPPGARPRRSGSGVSASTSTWPRITVSGVRSSWEASATNSRWLAKAAVRRSSMWLKALARTVDLGGDSRRRVDSRLQVARIDPFGDSRHAPQRLRGACADQHAAQQRAQDRQHPAEDERPRDALLGAVNARQRLADPDSHRRRGPIAAAHPERPGQDTKVPDIRKGECRKPGRCPQELAGKAILVFLLRAALPVVGLLRAEQLGPVGARPPALDGREHERRGRAEGPAPDVLRGGTPRDRRAKTPPELLSECCMSLMSPLISLSIWPRSWLPVPR